MAESQHLRGENVRPRQKITSKRTKEKRWRKEEEGEEGEEEEEEDSWGKREAMGGEKGLGAREQRVESTCWGERNAVRAGVAQKEVRVEVERQGIGGSRHGEMRSWKAKRGAI